MRIKKLISNLLKIGVKGEISRQEVKNIILLNFGCIVWIPLNILFIMEDVFLNKAPLNNILTFFSTAIILVFVMFLQRRYYYVIARIIFVLLSLIHYMVFAIYLEPGSFLEYYMLLIPVFSLIFFNNHWFSFITWIISYTCFTFIMIWFDNYKGIEFQHSANFVLFLSIYFAFAYFKELNIKSEKSLEDQRLQLEKQRKELEELNRFQTHFWINLSHEIRTPLTLIKGSSAKLQKEKDPKKLLDHYRRIEQNSDKIHLLVDNIMDLSKMKSNKLEINCKPININRFCKKALNSFEPLFTQKNIHYSFINKTENTGIKCNLDQLFLERALCNLLLNACNYTPENGKIELITKSYEEEVSITVKDNGCGIPENELPYIFDAFYRAKNAINESGGTGIGLSFSKEVIELHHGSITVRSIEKEGAEFTIILPIYEISRETEELYAPVSISENNSRDTKILLVEDNTEMRKYIKEVLSGYTLIEAREGNEALGILSHTCPDLIITDYMMPEMNGFEFVQNIRKKECDIPVIVLTARVDKEAKINFLRLGLDDYLTKPFNEEELIIRVAHSLKNNKERLQFNENDEDNLMLKCEELDKLRKIIESNMQSSSFGVTELADILVISKRTLHRKIKSWCGLTPNGFIREVKLQKAMAFYKNNEVNSIKELTSEVGFTNSGHLATLFEDRFGKKLDFKFRLLSRK